VSERPFRLGFVTPAFGRVGSDGVWTTPGIGRLVDEVSRQVGRFTLALSRVEGPEYDHRLAIPNEDVLELPPLMGIAPALSRIGRAGASSVRSSAGRTW
jgi:hypothetical protein